MRRRTAVFAVAAVAATPTLAFAAKDKDKERADSRKAAD